MTRLRSSSKSPFRPMPMPFARMGRQTLASSASVMALALAGAVLASPASAQSEGTLPGAEVLQGGRWSGAKMPTVAQGNDGLVMTIVQEQERALLDWQRFNIAANEEVVFDQQDSSWIALNRIFDSRPSEIAGKITAKGQVWLQNTNGIIFRDGAQVNAHSILATALPISEEQFLDGLLTNNSKGGLIRGTTTDLLFYDQNMPFVPKAVDGLNVDDLLADVPSGYRVDVSGGDVTVLDVLAAAVIRYAVIDANGMEDVSTSDQGFGLSMLQKGGQMLVDRNFSYNGLNKVLLDLAADLDLSQLGDYDYSAFTSDAVFFEGVSWQGKPATIKSLPPEMVSALAAQIKAQFVDNYDSHVAATKQTYADYIVNSRITVEAGASLTAASTDGDSPGKIMLFGPNVSNAGTLTAHDGQVLLAAGEQILLSDRTNYTNSVRGGLAVNVMATSRWDEYGTYPGMYYGQPGLKEAWEGWVLDRQADLGMGVVNSGTILSERGAVTLAGASVDQLGSILVTNGVRQRTGNIILQASHGFNNSAYSLGGNYWGGTLTLGENSLTQITPDLSDLTALAIDTFDPGQVLLAGTDILLDEGAKVISRSGEVIVHANAYGSGANRGSSPAAGEGGDQGDARGDAGSFTMKSGALIDVSGLEGVERSVADNFFDVEVRSNEVSASPAQRDGILIGETVTVDRREGASIVDWTGALTGEQRTAQEMSTGGGSVEIRATKYAAIDDGALIDVSGGSTEYTAAEVSYTRLQDTFGRFHNISEADPNLQYVGIEQVTRSEAGYTEGADAGDVTILSGSSRLFGKLKGDVTIGERQVLAAVGQIAAPLMPSGAVGAEFVTTTAMPKAGSAVLASSSPTEGVYSSRHAFITADEEAFTGTIWSEEEGAWIGTDMLLDPSLVGQDWEGYEGTQPEFIQFVEDDFFSGMGDVSFGFLSAHQGQAINSGVDIRLAPGGSFSLYSEGGPATVGDNVRITIPSGSIDLGALDGLTMGSGIALNVAAGWINDVDAAADLLRGYVDGGTISLGGVTLTDSITLDASGGGWYQRLTPDQPTRVGQFELIEGKGGSISFDTSRMSIADLLGYLDISLAGLAGGGSLSLRASGNVVIGPEGGSTSDGEYLDDTLFRDMGVGSLELEADSLRVAEGANLLFQTRNMQFTSQPYDVVTGSDLGDYTDLILLPAHLRKGGTLSLLGNDVTVEAGALVQVDALGTIVLGGVNTTIGGTARVHGGTIRMNGLRGTSAKVTLDSGSLLDVSGIAQTQMVPGGADGRGFWYEGRIVEGGSVNIRTGNLLMDQGAVIDVSGASGLLSVWTPGRYGLVKVNQEIGSDAGAIDIDATSGYLLGDFLGEAGSAYNYAGTLSLQGGQEGRALIWGDAGANNSQYGVEKIVYDMAYRYTSRANTSYVRQYLTFAEVWDNHRYLASARESTGLTGADLLDIQLRDTPGSRTVYSGEVQDILRAALQPLTNAGDGGYGLLFDPTMTGLPADMPLAGPMPIEFGLLEGYDPVKFRNTVIALLALNNVDLESKNLTYHSTLNIGASVLGNMKGFDTVNLRGNFVAPQAVDISSQRVLNISGGFNGTHDMSFSSRNIYLGAGEEQNPVLNEATSGTLTISGEVVEITSKFAVGGFDTVVVEASGDLRGGYRSTVDLGEDSNLTPGIDTTADLVLRAAQIYPVTDGILRFDSARSITVERSGRSDAPLSAGGLLILDAPEINQGGTLRAPFGEIRLTASGATLDGEYVDGVVNLLDGSITSTSADGRTILYGSTFDGQSWYAPLREGGASELTTPPEKRVSLAGDVVDVAEGALIDVSGGGDVLGLEFVAGPLGQENVLAQPGVFAVVPAYGDSLNVPIDPLNNPGSSQSGALALGSAVWLEAFDGYAAGWYTLLPAEYALTPGGYAISMVSEKPTVTQAREMGDSSFYVSGRKGVTGTSIMDQTFATYRLESGEDVRNRSEFFETYGNTFFSSERFIEGLLRSGNPYNADPRLPADGGFLTLAANSNLVLDGTIRADGVSGARGGVVDITSDNIVVAAPGTDVSDLAGYLVLDPNMLSNVAESLLIGGVRRQGASGLEVVVGLEDNRTSASETLTEANSIGAENVIIRTDDANPLTGTELLFAARQQVLVESGSVAMAKGDGADAADLAIAPSLSEYVPQYGDGAPAEDWGGAFLRVSNLGDITVSRSNVQSRSGNLIVESGAMLRADDSIILDSTESTILADGASVDARALTAAAGLVSLGNVPSGAEGLVFAGATLDALSNAETLTLKSYSTFDFYGDVSLDLAGVLTLDGAGLVSAGASGGTVNLAAGTVALRNSDAAAIDMPDSGGTLAVNADNIVIGEGDMAFAFDSSMFDAAERVILAGAGEDHFAGALTMKAVEIAGDSGSSHLVRAAGAVDLLSNAETGTTPDLAAFASAGSLLDFEGSGVNIGTVIRSGSGTVRATATEDDVHLLAGARIDVQGADVSFFEVEGFLPGGSIELTSLAGDVRADEGSVLDISGGSNGGDAGSLVLSAGKGVAVLNGMLQAGTAEGYKGGAFALTTSTLADFGGLNAMLNASGISRSRDFAILDGDVLLNGTTLVDALRIVTGTGDISVAADAVLGSESAKGGYILLASGGDLTIAGGASFDVSAKGEDLRGGAIDLQVASGGTISAGSANMNVAGNGEGQAGIVRLRAAQTATDVNVANWVTSVTGGDTQLEAFRVYDLDDADGDAGNGYLAEVDRELQVDVVGDAVTFMDARADAIRTRLGQNGNSSFLIVPGIELRSDGDMDLRDNWNLKDARFYGQGGVLTLRAGGDLLINANLSDGMNDAMPTEDIVAFYQEDVVDTALAPAEDFTNDNSWSYNLVAGADFAQTNILATNSASDGGILVGGLVRTGTGDINLAAAGDLTYEEASTASYSFSSSDGTSITVSAGAVIPDGTVLMPTTYLAKGGAGGSEYVTRNPMLTEGTVLRKGTLVPAGTMLNGMELASDTVLSEDVTLLADTTFPGEVVISGKTRLGSALEWFLPLDWNSDPDLRALAPLSKTVGFSIAGLGDVEVAMPVSGSGSSELRTADHRAYGRSNSPRTIEMMHGAIYTVGVEDAPVDGFVESPYIVHNKELEKVETYRSYMVNPSYMTNGGDVAINVGGSITGTGSIYDNFRWMSYVGNQQSTTLGVNLVINDPETLFDDAQTSLSLLADHFLQGVGALGGGDVSITSGGSVDNLVVALPAWVRVSGGTAENSQAKQLHLSGGGDLVMNIGQNLSGGMIQLGRGAATIDVAGSVGASDRAASYLATPNNGDYLQVVLDDAQFNLQAGGDIAVRNVTSTLGVERRAALTWLGYTKDTALNLTSLGGDITYLGATGVSAGGSASIGQDILPNNTAFVAPSGSITLGANQSGKSIAVDAWQDGQLDLLAMDTINFRADSFTIGYSDPLYRARAINPGGTPYNEFLRFVSPIQRNPDTGEWEFTQAGPGFGIDGNNVHSGSDSYARIYADQGDILGWKSGTYFRSVGAQLFGGNFTFGNETRLKAGGDIRLGQLTFIQHDLNDVSTLEAGGSVYLPDAIFFGAGRLWVQAGDEVWMGNTAGRGIRAREAVSIIPGSQVANGGSISVLAGIDQEPEYAAFFAAYLNPEDIGSVPSYLRRYFVEGDVAGLSESTNVVLADGSTQATVYAIDLVNYMRALRGEDLIATEAPDDASGTRPVTRAALVAQIDPDEYDAALAAFAELDPVRQRGLAVQILNAELKTAGREAVGQSPETDGRYERQGDPTRGYAAIGTLFPGAQHKPGEALAEGEHTWTGDISMKVSQIRAESGGGIDLLAPGGSIQLASLSVANTNPGTSGVITQRGGSVNALTYGDYVVNQSRTMTADDGDILIWSSFGNIDAGRGRKSSLSVPPVSFPIDDWGTTQIILSGLPNGAGIATLDKVDGTRGGDVDLYAFNGIVNAGDAGIRASRDLFIGAIEIRGLDNITVGGVTNVELDTGEGDVGPLNLENFAQSMEDEALEQAFEISEQVEQLRTVRQTILTGSVESFGIEEDEAELCADGSEKVDGVCNTY